MGGCLSLKQVESVASPGPYPARKHAKKPNDRLSCSDFSNSTTPADLSSSLVGTNLHKFSLAELKVVCQNFNTSNYVGEGGFGPVFKGFVDEKIVPGLKGQAVAVKQMDLEGVQGHKEWLTEVILLGQLRHPHLVKLIGYCYEDEHRMLIYEYMTRGSLDNHLFKKYFSTLPWKTRIQIAIGAAKGLQFLHETDQQVIYRDFKASNILLDSEYKAKLSDFGLAKDGPQGEDTHVSTRVMGTQGYAAPEYIMTGHLTAKSDVYSFGVVLLEILTGRQCLDKTRPSREQNLVDWAKYFLNDGRKLSRIMDPALEGQYSTKGAQKAAALAYQCLSYLPKNRPDMSTVVKMLEPLQDLNDIPLGTFVFNNVKEGEGGNDKKPKERSSNEVEPKRENRRQKEKQQHGGHGRRRNPGSVNHSDTALYRRKSPDDNGL